MASRRQIGDKELRWKTGLNCCRTKSSWDNPTITPPQTLLVPCVLAMVATTPSRRTQV